MSRIKYIALIICCLQTVLLFAQDLNTRLNIADSLTDAGEDQKALKLTLQLANEFPKNGEVYATMAFCYNKLGEDQKCLSAIDKAMELGVEDDIRYGLYYVKADCYSHMMNEKESMKYCEKYLKYRPNDGYALDLRGWLFFEAGNYDKAIVDFQTALKDTEISVSEKAYALALTGSAYLQKEDFQKARFYDSLALLSNKDDHDANVLLADLLFYDKDFQKALTHYERLLEKDTSAHTLLYNIADCHYSLKNYDKAISYFKAYLVHYPESSDVNNMIAWILFLQKKYLEGLPYAHKAIVQDDANADAYDTRGCILYKKGDYVSAINDFTKSLKLDKTTTNSYYFRGLCFLKTNQKAEACKDFEKVKEDKSYELKEGELPVQELISLNCGK